MLELGMSDSPGAFIEPDDKLTLSEPGFFSGVFRPATDTGLFAREAGPVFLPRPHH